ncbi:MAG: adenylate/guanylate cyclase domain-containing protein [Nevskia sp.]
MPLDLPETCFAVRGADRIAYQILGAGSRDLVFTTGVWSHLEVFWEEPTAARFMRRIAGFSRLIRFDRRGSGLSDARPGNGGSLVDHWIEDLLTVIDAVGAKAPVMAATIDAGPLLLEFVHRHPERCSGLVLINTTASFRAAPDYPEGHVPEVAEHFLQLVAASWGREEFAVAWNPSLAGNTGAIRWYGKLNRAMASPRAVIENLGATGRIDSRHVLPGIRVPALVIARRELKVFTPAQGRYIADHIANAKYVELPGADADVIWEGVDEILAQMQEFVTGARPDVAPERVLATLLFTDIVDSTRQLAKLGDAAWRERLDQHDRIVHRSIAAYGGRLVDTAGDGTLATFGTPGSAIDCALALQEALAPLKIELRAGLHIGEIELREEGRIGGMAVHIGARVLGRADGGEVLISRTVRDVLIGSTQYEFNERGIHTLKGVPSKWPLYAATAAKRG